MNVAISLPPLAIPQENFCSTVIKFANRVYALYQVNDSDPFWLVEMDVAAHYQKPTSTKPVKHHNHVEALEALTEWATRIAR